MAISVESAQAVVDDFLASYNGNIPITAIVRDRPEEVYGEKASKEAYGASIQGSYHAGSGKFTLFASAVRDVSGAQAVIRHELLGHYGLNTFAPEEKLGILQAVTETRNEPSLARFWAHVDEHYSDKSEFVKAEEVFAFVAEEPRNFLDRSWDRVRAALQRVLRSVGLSGRPLTLSELRETSQSISRGIRQGDRQQQTFPANDQAQFSRGRDSMTDKKPFHKQVAERLIEQLEQGTAPWQKPWSSGLPMNPVSGKTYRGINVINLMSCGYSDPRWMTYKQASGLNAQVRKGEAGTTIQFWKFNERSLVRDEDGKPVLDDEGNKQYINYRLERPIVSYARVFNAEQIDGLPELKRGEVVADIERVEKVLEHSGAKISHDGGAGAYYMLDTDSIHLPQKQFFNDTPSYYATALHELGHWTGHPSRLNRDLAHPFGSTGYAMEELRAEISSMMMGVKYGIGHDPGQHAAYVKSWVKKLREDPNEIFRAAAAADKIVDYVAELEQKRAIEIDHERAGEAQLERPSKMTEDRTKSKIFIDVPFKDKNEAKELGARWDKQEKSWYIREGMEREKFAKWPDRAVVQETSNTQAMSLPEANPAEEKRFYLAVPYAERFKARDAGARWDKAAKSWYAPEGSNKAKFEQWHPERSDVQSTPVISPEAEFADYMRSHGAIVSKGHPAMDGKKHRIECSGDKKGSQSGFYIAYLDGHPAGYFMNNRSQEGGNWKAKGFSLSPEEKAILMAEAANKMLVREEERNRLENQTAKNVAARIKTLGSAPNDNAYLVAKNLAPTEGLFFDPKINALMVPAQDIDGKIWSVQRITNGRKLFEENSRKTGCFHVVGGFDKLADLPALVVSEGYSTAATLAQAVGHSTVAVFDSGNLPEVAKILAERFPDKPIIIAGDDDVALEKKTGKNPGRKKALEAAEIANGKAIFPIFAPGEFDANPKEFTDFNDLANKSVLGREGVIRQIQPVVNAMLQNHKERVLDQSRKQHRERVRAKEQELSIARA